MSAVPTPLRLVVDLCHLQPGGANGGIKVFLFELLGWLGRQKHTPLTFIFLTRSRTHAEVRDALARPHDEVVCIVEDTDHPLPRAVGRMPQERRWNNPPADLVWRLRADVLYCPFGPPDFACAGVPTLCAVVDVLHRDFPASLPPAELARREAYFRRLIEAADAIQCISHYVEDRLREHYQVPSTRMFTVYLAVQSRFQRRFNSPTPSDAGEPHFFFPANAWTHKNHEVLLLAYRLYRRNVLSAGGRPWPLELTGHEDERWRTLQSVASSLGLTSSVHFRGFVDSPTMEGLWSGAGCLVFPSLHEGFGIPLLEAMHHGVPVIASDATSLPEVGGDACVFVNARKPEALADAMIRVASNPALRGDLARRGRERIRSFCWPDEAARLLDRIIELAQGRAWRPAVWGVDDDGFMDDVAHISLPRLDVRCRLEITTERTKRSPRIVLAAGDAPLGSLNPGVEPHGRFSTSIYPNGRALRLLVRRRKRWSWFRFRSPRRDACLTSARLICPDGAAIDLLGRS